MKSVSGSIIRRLGLFETLCSSIAMVPEGRSSVVRGMQWVKECPTSETLLLRLAARELPYKI